MHEILCPECIWDGDVRESEIERGMKSEEESGGPTIASISSHCSTGADCFHSQRSGSVTQVHTAGNHVMGLSPHVARRSANQLHRRNHVST